MNKDIQNKIEALLKTPSSLLKKKPFLRGSASPFSQSEHSQEVEENTTIDVALPKTRMLILS